jgi:beta-mannosidase
MLELVRDSGANIVRLAGTGTYAPSEFHELCDELGIMVWQDLMFANYDYPFGDDDFVATARAEVDVEIGRIAGRPSLVVVCGGSEVAQQAAMFGVATWADDLAFFTDEVPAILDRLGCDAPYVPSSPWGGVLPFRSDRGVAHYFGVGGYRRPLVDSRVADVRFASECLAFGNVPEAEGLAEILPGAPLDVVVADPAWKIGVPRDVGSEWDFDDVRDHYLAECYGVEPVELRASDHSRYLTLARRVTGEVMQEVFGEWRREGSSCAGGIVLWWRDLVPGAGWGVIDSGGRPKAAYHLVKRLLAPLAVWTTDEGLGGVQVHVANDGPERFAGVLRIGLYRDAELRVEGAEVDVDIPRHATTMFDVEALIGRFVDPASAYGFGPPSHDLIVATLIDRDGVVRSEHVRFPSGRPVATRSVGEIGLEVESRWSADASIVELTLRSRALALGVRVRMDGFEPSDDVFDIAPGGRRLLNLTPLGVGAVAGHAEITADNMDDVLTVNPDAVESASHHV